GSRSTGFYCIAGCTSKPGSTSTHLDYPYAAVFDNFGNIFVTDQDNHRIQKFLLITNNPKNFNFSSLIIYLKYFQFCDVCLK
ncbi:unnamed protein product, partial [Adineta steineri]